MARPDSIDAGLDSTTPSKKNAEKLVYRSISGLDISLAYMVVYVNYRIPSKFESLLKGSEPLFIASGKQYSIVAFPDDKTGTGRLNATESDRVEEAPCRAWCTSKRVPR